MAVVESHLQLQFDLSTAALFYQYRKDARGMPGGGFGGLATTATAFDCVRGGPFGFGAVFAGGFGFEIWIDGHYIPSFSVREIEKGAASA